ncbi:ATP-binding protein [Maribacter algicola]|uniref:ATP-binding protein n=1 Tax=Meishania litoralis TaxID=3434685 RepID=A0ACC7LKP9_9FLAO
MTKTYNCLDNAKLLAICFLYLLHSCGKQGHHSKPDAQNVAQDSVLIWIENSLDNQKSNSERLTLLKRAREAATGKSDDTVKLKYFSRIQWSFLMLDDSVEFRKSNKMAKSIGISIGDSANVARRTWDLAYFFEKKGIKDSAYYHYAQAQKIFASLNDQLNAAKFLFFMANIQQSVKDYVGGEANTIKAIELLKPLDANEDLYSCYNLLGVIAKDLKEFDRALDYYNTANYYLQKLENKKTFEAFENNNLGVVYMEMGDYKQAIFYFSKITEQDVLKKSKPDLYARAQHNLAESKYKSGDIVGVEGLLKKALRTRDSIRDLTGMAGSYYYLAEYYLGKQDSITALSHAQKAKEYAAQIENNERLLETLQLLTRVDPQNATNYTREYINLNDSLQLAERKLRDKFARIRFETDEFIAENETLTKEKRLWAGIAIGVLVMAFLGYLVIDQRRKNQKLRFQRAQQTANQEIFNLMLSQQQKFDEGKKMEQKRISEELHDGVLGKMLGARMVLTGLNKKSDDEALGQKKEALELLRNIEGEIRSISHELSNTAYSDMPNFINSIQNLMETTENVSEINTTFNHDNQVKWDGLSGDIKINLYRIVQESIQNVVKHAQSNNLVVNFAAVNDLLDISIIDDGKGFDLKKRKKGIGMRNISSRIDKLGGSWHIESEKGKGTGLYLKIPIMYHSEELDNILKQEGIKVKV